MRAIGIEKGYYDPSNWKQAAKIDWIVETWGSLISAQAGIALQPLAMPGKKAEEYTALLAEKWAPFLAALEK